MKGAGLTGPEERPKVIRKDDYIVGRRMWVLARDSERWRLGNIAHHTEEYWPRGVYEADCANWTSHPSRHTPSPVKGCVCGMYGFWDMENLAAQYHAGHVTGIVYSWGHVLPGVEGYKAQYMMPVALDWPLCMGKGDVPLKSGEGCDGDVEYAYFTQHSGRYQSLRWMEPFPGRDDAEFETAHEWVDLRGVPAWLCAECLHDHGWAGQGGEDGFVTEAWRIFTDLERYYELEVLPPLDFAVDNKR